MVKRDKLLGCFLLCAGLSLTAEAGLFDKLQNGLNNLNVGQSQERQQQPKSESDKSDQKTFGKVVYSGYSAKFLPVKQLIYDGKLQDAVEFYATGGKSDLPTVRDSFKDQIDQAEAKANTEAIDLTDEGLGFLISLEHGTLLLDSGKSQDAIVKFEEAQRILDVREEEGTVTEQAKAGFMGVFGTIVGNEELGRYDGEGFEKVLMLNFHSLGYLLNGDRRAFNVAKKAIDWQQIEERKFQEQLVEIEKKLSQEKKDENASEDGADSATEMLGNELKRFEDRANAVASAYVNPFGWYVNAMILEFESYQYSGLWSNARIAYQKAHDLNPDSAVIKSALTETKKRSSPNKNKRIFHMLIADGFAPEKKILYNEIPTNFGPVALKLPLYEPVHNPVDRIEVRDRKGKKLAVFSTIADVEAIALRHQKDSEPFNNFRAIVGFIRGIAQAKLMSQAGVFGMMLNKKLEEQQTPDTRSWMSLPSRIQGVRLHLSKKIKTLQIVSFDKDGKVLGKKTFKLNGRKQEFVYARSINGELLVQRPEKLWLQGG